MDKDNESTVVVLGVVGHPKPTIVEFMEVMKDYEVVIKSQVSDEKLAQIAEGFDGALKSIQSTAHLSFRDINDRRSQTKKFLDGRKRRW